MASSASSRRPFGWIIAGVLFGAFLGYESAQDRTVWYRWKHQRLAAAVREAERAVPLVLVGSAAGVLIGWAAERFARRQRWIEIVLLLAYAALICLILNRFLR